jgi:hypothetical protein
MFLKNTWHAVFLVAGLCIGLLPFLNAGIEGLWGDNWRAFSTDTKNMYVLAYIKGVDEGYRRACNKIFETNEDARRQCLIDIPNYSKATDVYVETLDSFYSNAKVRYVFPETVLDDLQDGRQLELEKLWAKYLQRYSQ